AGVARGAAGVPQESAPERRKARSEHHRDVELRRRRHDTLLETEDRLVDHRKDEARLHGVALDRRLAGRLDTQGAVRLLRGAPALSAGVVVEALSRLAPEAPRCDESL